MLDFDACGIEIEGELVDAAQQLADDFGLPVEFIRGSFIRKGGDPYRHTTEEFAWLTPDESTTHDELARGPDEMNAEELLSIVRQQRTDCVSPINASGLAVEQGVG